jgi:hypothetical protein
MRVSAPVRTRLYDKKATSVAMPACAIRQRVSARIPPSPMARVATTAMLVRLQTPVREAPVSAAHRSPAPLSMSATWPARVIRRPGHAQIQWLPTVPPAATETHARAQIRVRTARVPVPVQWYAPHSINATRSGPAIRRAASARTRTKQMGRLAATATHAHAQTPAKPAHAQVETPSSALPPTNAMT